MKILIQQRPISRWWFKLAWLTLITGFISQGATLQDFGYNNMKRGGVAAQGQPPLLVILAAFDGQGLMNTNEFYDSLVFDILVAKETVNGYFWENSNHRFAWSKAAPAGYIGKFNHSLSESITNWSERVKIAGQTNIPGLVGGLWFSNIVAKIMINNQFDFSPFDTNNNNVVTSDELAILVVSNDPNTLGSKRGTHNVKEGTSTVSVNVGAAEWRDGASINLLIHETSHLLLTVDLYNTNPDGQRISQDRSILADSSCCPPVVYHMDPWHKMQLGWIEPNIRSLRTGGFRTLRAVNYMEPDEFLILYDPLRGVGEFFILEYRSLVNPPGSNIQYDYGRVNSGMVMWHVKQDANHNPLEVIRPGNIKHLTVYTEGSPNLSFGGNQAWTGGMITPSLHWDDGSTMTATIRVHPFSEGDPNLTVEWLWMGDFWADFNHTGTQLGTFSSPWASLALAVPSAPRGAVVNIKPSTTSEQPRLTKPMTFKAWNGPVTIGR